MLELAVGTSGTGNMIWHCEYCDHTASVGLVTDLRTGVEASCPRCSERMKAEEPVRVVEVPPDREFAVTANSL